ncbi:hypothetical protein WG66_006070 [Moniliophthora roreri]|nr:hypothetical protein WG66_006070 [Moniliophthora roreri]
MIHHDAQKPIPEPNFATASDSHPSFDFEPETEWSNKGKITLTYMEWQTNPANVVEASQTTLTGGYLWR